MTDMGTPSNLEEDVEQEELHQELDEDGEGGLVELGFHWQLIAGRR